MRTDAQSMESKREHGVHVCARKCVRLMVDDSWFRFRLDEFPHEKARGHVQANTRLLKSVHMRALTHKEKRVKQRLIKSIHFLTRGTIS